jgi:hypothetical protein
MGYGRKNDYYSRVGIQEAVGDVCQSGIVC